MKRLLISRCLLGDPCRYDGKSKPLPAETLEALRERYRLIPVCPEVLGGLPTPRTPSERQGDRVVMKTGADVTKEYRRGAETALRAAQENRGCAAVLKERSPSCGKGKIYDGSFTGKLKSGSGVTAEALAAMGLSLYDENDAASLAREPDAKRTTRI